MAIVLCLMSIGGFAANTTVAHAAKQDAHKIGLSLPLNDTFYRSLFTRYVMPLPGNDYELDTREFDPKSEVQQVSAIMDLISANVEMLIVAQGENPDAIADALQEAHEGGIYIIIFGRPNENYPDEDILYFRYDYYKLGREHAQSLISSITDSSRVHFYYYNDADGWDYKEGAQSVFEEFGFYGISYICVNDLDEVESYVRDWFDRNPGVEVDEIRSYGDIPDFILELYHSMFYFDNSNETGTGIGVLVDENEIEGYFAALAQKIADEIESIMDGEIPNGEVTILDFVPGYVQYVSPYSED